MNVTEFLSCASSPEWWHSVRSLCFVTKDVSHLFFLKLFEQLTRKGALALYPRVVTALEGSLLSLQATLQQSMLGFSEVYFLGDPLQGEKSERKRAEFQAFFSAYEGPHTILWCSSSQPKAMDGGRVIVLDEVADEKLLSDLVAFFELALPPAKKALLQSLASSMGALSLEAACSMLDYIKLISLKGQSKDEILTYINRIVPSNVSLFTLSDYFFSNRSAQFFQLWKVINEQYPDVFWVAYWSDQVWRAHNVLFALKSQDLKAARLASSRLPFSFLRQHARKYTYQYFARAHAFLYDADFAIKTGSLFCSLDLFFAQHFVRGFD